MLQRYIKSKKGSTLVMVMLALAILSILGIALLSLAVVNIKTNYADKNAKTSLYLSESGLDQAYQKICAEVSAAIQEAINQIEDNNIIENYIADERDKEKGTDIVMPENSPLIRNYENGDINPNGEIDQEVLYQYVNSRFKEYYYSYLKRTESGAIVTALVEALDNVDFSAVYQPIFGGTSIPLISVESYEENASDVIVTLSSEYQHEGITKVTRITYNITAPNYNEIYTVGTDVQYNLPKNALFEKALVAENDIFVNGNNVTINGDIYAGGSKSNPIAQTGILVGGNGVDGKLTVNGRTITGGFIRANESGSSISLQGNVFCNTLFIPESVDSSIIQVGVSGAENSKYNVSTLEDLRIDGSRAKLNIYGNYYGFSKGDTSELNRSSIVINSDDFGADGSSIVITGDNAANEKFPDNTVKPVGNIIAGTSFINLDQTDTPVLYQTGESVSVKGNYVAYTQGLLRSAILGSPNYASGSGDEDKYDQEHIYFQSLAPLYIATGFDTDANGEFNDSDTYFGGEDTIPTVSNNGINYLLYKGLQDKTKYFMYSYDQDPNLVYFGTPASMAIQNVLYSTGIFIDRDEGASPQKPHINNDVIDAIPKLRHEYNYYVNAMGDPQIDSYLNPNSFNDYPNDGITDTVRTIEDFFSFSQSINYFQLGELLYSSPDNKAIVLNGAGSGYADDHWNASSYDVFNTGDGKVEGIIVTRGDVYLYGKIDFTGTIITTGSIYFMDDNPKTITNNYDELNITEDNNYLIKTVYAHLRQPNTQIGDLFLLTGTERIYAALTTIDKNEGSEFINFDQIIRASSWQRVR